MIDGTCFRAASYMLLLILVSFPGLTNAAPQAEKGERIILWPKGAPGFEGQVIRPEIAKDYYVRQIDSPSLTIFRPPVGLQNGTAVVILPGGGHRLLVIDSEGNDAARFMAERGVTAFVLRYRLFRDEDSPYSINDARRDTERAIEMVRDNAVDYGISPDRIGIMAFSAGGELARMALLGPQLSAADQDTSGRPDFGILIYPGPLKAEPESMNANAPPLFLVATNDDTCCAAPIVELLNLYRAVSAPVELHLYARGGHAFNMGQRTDNAGLARWPERLDEWMRDSGLLTTEAQD